MFPRLRDALSLSSVSLPCLPIPMLSHFQTSSLHLPNLFLPMALLPQTPLHLLLHLFRPTLPCLRSPTYPTNLRLVLDLSPVPLRGHPNPSLLLPPRVSLPWFPRLRLVRATPPFPSQPVHRTEDPRTTRLLYQPVSNPG